MWKCTGCDWSGDGLVPTSIPGGLQGKVKTFACPRCGKILGGGVVMLPEEKPGPKPKPKPDISVSEMELETASEIEVCAASEPVPLKTPEPEVKPKKFTSRK